MKIFKEYQANIIALMLESRENRNRFGDLSRVDHRLFVLKCLKDLRQNRKMLCNIK